MLSYHRILSIRLVLVVVFLLGICFSSTALASPSNWERCAYTFVLAPDGTLYVGLEGRIARSQNQGQSWSFSDQGLPPQMPVFDLSVVRQAKDDYLLYAATRDGVYRSMDQGKSWQRRSRGLGRIEEVSLDWDGRGGMIAATPLGLYRRSPGEEIWKPTASAFKYKRFYDVSSHPTSGTIYAGIQSGLVRSRDRGQTWQEVVSDLTSHGMPAVLVDPKAYSEDFIECGVGKVLIFDFDGDGNKEQSP
jgi:photosystem II stability/assembly factor-like uncharacterized protein